MGRWGWRLKYFVGSQNKEKVIKNSGREFHGFFFLKACQKNMRPFSNLSFWKFFSPNSGKQLGAEDTLFDAWLGIDLGIGQQAAWEMFFLERFMNFILGFMKWNKYPNWWFLGVFLYKLYP